jgi:hypothetical protein
MLAQDSQQAMPPASSAAGLPDADPRKDGSRLWRNHESGDNANRRRAYRPRFSSITLVKKALTGRSLRGTLRDPQKAVLREIRVVVITRDRAATVYAGGSGALVRGGAGTGDIEGNQGSPLTPHKAVIHVIGIGIVACDRAAIVDAEGNSAQEPAGAGAGDIEGDQGSPGTSQKAVEHIIGV